MNRAFTLITGDIRSVTRDSLLVLVLAAPVLILGILRFGIPPLTAILSDRFAFDLIPYYPLIFIFFCALLPMLFGMIVGLVMLDEQDEHIIQFVAVTPLTRTGRSPAQAT